MVGLPRLSSHTASNADDEIQGLTQVNKSTGTTVHITMITSYPPFFRKQNSNYAAGEIMVRTTSGELVAVDVNDLSDAITREMSSLKAELTSIRSEREHELRSVSEVFLRQLTSKLVYQDT